MGVVYNIPEYHIMHCILRVILTERQQFIRKVKGNILAALPTRISTILQIIRAKSNDLLIENTARPRYKNTPDSKGRQVSVIMSDLTEP